MTFEQFHSCVGHAFVVAGAASPVTLRLKEAEPRGHGVPGGRTPFTLLFEGPPAPILPQATYSFTHPDLGEIAIFIVPVGPQAGHMRYEAVFN